MTLSLIFKVEPKATVDHVATAMQAVMCREQAGIGLRALARRMKIPASYLCDLEQGRRGWSESMVGRFNHALKGAKP